LKSGTLINKLFVKYRTSPTTSKMTIMKMISSSQREPETTFKPCNLLISTLSITLDRTFKDLGKITNDQVYHGKLIGMVGRIVMMKA